MIDMPGDSMIIKGDYCIYVPFLDILFHNSSDQSWVPPNMRIILQIPDGQTQLHREDTCDLGQRTDQVGVSREFYRR